jgi:NAD(P) transhydrogenase subunit beta
MSMNLIVLLYLLASVCFIQALKGLSHPTTSIRGNLFGMAGMTIAVLTTVGYIVQIAGGVGAGMGWVLVGLLVGGTAGAIMAQRVEMTKMPELVAFMHSMIGLAAVFIAIAAVVEPQAFGIAAAVGQIPKGNRMELFLGAAIGAITFSGSVIAFGKLSGKCPGPHRGRRASSRRRGRCPSRGSCTRPSVVAPSPSASRRSAAPGCPRPGRNAG